jgi:hypothetical protein
MNRILKGDGSWPFTAEIDGDDIVLRHVKVTCFGGAADPQDDGSTASGENTKLHPEIQGVSVPMDIRRFKLASRAAHAALDGCPIPVLPFHTAVKVTVAGKPPVTFSSHGVIDRGPGKQATRHGDLPHALDLTEAAARQFDPQATARNFSAIAEEVRLLGAAKYAPA